MIKSIAEMKTLDFSNMKIVGANDGKSTLIDKDFQKNFLKVFKTQINQEFEQKFNSEEFRFKESEDDDNKMKVIRDAIDELNKRLNQSITNSNEIILLQNDPRFKKDFETIIKKQELLSKMNKYKTLLNSIEGDTVDPVIKRM